MDNEYTAEAAEQKHKTPFGKFADTFGKAAADTSAKTKSLAAKAQEAIVSAVDKNGNGKIDAEDFGLGKENLQETRVKVSHLASLAGQRVRSGGERLGKAFDELELNWT